MEDERKESTGDWQSSPVVQQTNLTWSLPFHQSAVPIFNDGEIVSC